MARFCVYRHIRPDKNEVFYVGIGLLKRAYQSISRNKHWKSIVRLNPNYQVEILFEDILWDECCKKEIELIKLYGRSDLGTGTLCNLTDGGEGSFGRVVSEQERKDKSERFLGSKNPMFGKKHSTEHKEKVSKKLKGKKNSAIAIRKLIEYNKTRIFTEATRLKMSRNTKNRKWTKDHFDRIVKAVDQLSFTGDLIATHFSIRQAERTTGIRSGDITSVCKSYRGAKTAGGFVWRYTDSSSPRTTIC